MLTKNGVSDAICASTTAPLRAQMKRIWQERLKVLKSIRMIKELDVPPPQTMVGLSNISQKCTNRSLINRTFTAMAMAFGLDGAILDVFDKELVETVIASRLLLNQDIYCDSFLTAYKNG